MKNGLVLFSFVLIPGCATYGGYTPTVDPRMDRNPYTLDQDMGECRQLAANAGSAGMNSLQQGATGAIVGAAGGAALGAILGNPATGAALGATIGGIGGATNGAMDGDLTFKRAYINCMRGRGHAVVD